MSMFLQGIFQAVLGWFQPILSKIKRKDVLLFLCFIGFQLLTTLAINQVIMGSSFVTYGAGCLLLALTILFSTKYPLKKTKWSLWMSIPWFLLTGLIIVTSIINDPRYLTVGALYLVAYPCFFFVWNSRGDWEKLFSIIVRAYAVFFVGVLVVTMVGYNPGADRFVGFFANPNSLGTYTATVAICLLVWADQCAQKSLWKMLLPWVLLGLCVGMCLMSRSRTSMMAIAAVFFVWFVVRLITAERKGQFLISVVVGLGCAVVGYFVLVLYYEFVRPVLENWLVQPAYAGSTLLDPVRGALDRWDAEGMTADRFSASRISIWKSYLPHLKLFGNAALPEALGIEKFAHMTALQIAFTHGIVAGVCYVALCLISAVRALGYAVRGRTPLAVFPLVVIVGYVAISLLESTYTPFCFHVEVLFYLVVGQHPKNRKEPMTTSRKHIIIVQGESDKPSKNLAQGVGYIQ